MGFIVKHLRRPEKWRRKKDGDADMTLCGLRITQHSPDFLTDNPDDSYVCKQCAGVYRALSRKDKKP